MHEGVQQARRNNMDTSRERVPGNVGAILYPVLSSRPKFYHVVRG